MRKDKPEKFNYEELDKNSKYKSAYLAGGCFWCMEPALESLDGVITVVSGYSGGDERNPAYEEVSSGSTGHREAIRVFYDPETISYEKILDAYWRQIDPTDEGGQFADRGFQYTTAIFYKIEEEKQTAERTKQELEQSGVYGKPIITPIVKFKSFYPAESYHQDYYKNNKLKYKFYRSRSGRDDYLEKVWSNEDSEYKKPDKKELKDKLTDEQYKITQQCGTETAFKNKYWDNKRAGIYVDVVSGEPLFSSTDKYDSGTGWPSFSKPLESNNIKTKTDWKLIMPRTEVKSKKADSHLGHVFNDGPKSTGKRYCINSAALRFISKNDLEKEGYGQYLSLFQ